MNARKFYFHIFLNELYLWCTVIILHELKLLFWWTLRNVVVLYYKCYEYPLVNLTKEYILTTTLTSIPDVAEVNYIVKVEILRKSFGRKWLLASLVTVVVAGDGCCVVSNDVLTRLLVVVLRTDSAVAKKMIRKREIIGRRRCDGEGGGRAEG